ncbi:MAG: carboxylesterase family protein [Mycobacterium sp.]|nr:carboxylesterase family protein [Mycobacterium sp.]
MSVRDHLVAPGSAGPFRAAILQSAPCQLQADLPTAQRLSVEFAEGLGCDDPSTAAQCLKAKRAEDFAESPWYVRLGADGMSGPATGTSMLPQAAVSAIGAGKAVSVPVLIGTNRDEFRVFAAVRMRADTGAFAAEDYPALVGEIFGGSVTEIQQQYPLPKPDGADVALEYAATVTDGVFACPTDRLAHALDAPVYAYEFADSSAPAPDLGDGLPFPIGASHALELQYLFEMGPRSHLDETQSALSEQMIDYWSAFVRSGSPSAPAAPEWPALNDDPAVGSPYMSLRPDGSRVVGDSCPVTSL